MLSVYITRSRPPPCEHEMFPTGLFLVTGNINIDNDIPKYTYQTTAHRHDRSNQGIILCMRSGNKGRRYIVTSFLIGSAHTQKDPYDPDTHEGKIRRDTGPWFNIMKSSYQYRIPHCGDKAVVWPSYLRYGTSYTGKIISLISPISVTLVPCEAKWPVTCFITRAPIICFLCSTCDKTWNGSTYSWQPNSATK